MGRSSVNGPNPGTRRTCGVSQQLRSVRRNAHRHRGVLQSPKQHGTSTHLFVSVQEWRSGQRSLRSDKRNVNAKHRERSIAPQQKRIVDQLMSCVYGSGIARSERRLSNGYENTCIVSRDANVGCRRP